MKRSRTGWRTIESDPAKVGPLLRKHGFALSEADPVKVRSSFDAKGRPRRVHARYADGVTCVLHIGAATTSLTQSLERRFVARKPS